MADSWQGGAQHGSGRQGTQSDATTTPPTPFPVALPCAVNPLPQLFTTFPAPSFSYAVPLTRPRAGEPSDLDCVSSGESLSEAAATDPGAHAVPGRCDALAGDAWSTVTVDRLVQHMHTSASSLLLSGGFHHLLQEQLHKECGDGSTEVGHAQSANTQSPATEAETNATRSAAAVVQRRAAALMQRLVRQSSQGIGLDRPAATATTLPPTTRAPPVSGSSASLASAKTTLGSATPLPGSYLISRMRPASNTAPVTAASTTSDAQDERWARSPEAHMRLRPRRTSAISVSSSHDDSTADDATSREPSRGEHAGSSPVKPGTRAATRRATVKRARSEDDLASSAGARQMHEDSRPTAKEALFKSSLEDLTWSSQSADALDNPLAPLVASALRNSSSNPDRAGPSAQELSLFPLATLRRLVQVLPLQSQPFQGFSDTDITTFLTQLVSPAVVQRAVTVPPAQAAARATTKASKAPGRGIKAEAVVKSEHTEDGDQPEQDGDVLMTIAMQGLCSCVCAAHPTFPTAAAPEGLTDRALATLSVVMRAVVRALSDAAVEAQEAVEAVEAAKDAAGSRCGARVKLQKAPTAAAASAGTAHHSLVAWLEVLRAYLKHLAIVACIRAVCLASDTDLVRLEDVCVQALFVIPHQCDKAILHTYTAYVMDGAVQLFRCVWNQLGVQRGSLAENFFPSFPLSDSLRVRSHVGPTGSKVMPLTVAVLAAAQSLPAMDSAESAEGLIWRQQQQCQLWASLIVRKLLVENMESAKPEVDIALSIAVQIAEDLTELLACPEWPAADPLLRALVLGLAQTCLSGRTGGDPATSAAASTEAGSVSSAAADWLRPLAIDVIAHVALKLYDSTGPFRTVHRVANGYLPLAADGQARSTSSTLDAVAANLVSETGVDDAFFSDWLHLVNTTSPTPDHTTKAKTGRAKAGGRGRRQRRAADEEANNGDEEGEERTTPSEHVKDEHHAQSQSLSPWKASLSPMEKLQALAYYTFTRRVEQARNTRPDTASAWWHARAAQLLSWQHLSQGQASHASSATSHGGQPAEAVPTEGPRAHNLAVPDGALLTLALAESTPNCGIDLAPAQFRWWLLVLSTGLERSMVSRRMGQTLLSLLLSVFQVKDARSNELEVSDVVVKKVLVALSSLTAMYPPLHRVIWQMARQCVRDSSARVRESMVPLLLTVLTTVLQGSQRVPPSPQHTDWQRKQTTAETLSLSEDEMNVVADAVSSLLHLLEDRSIAVVSRTVGALETILTEPFYRPLLASSKGAVLLAFAEYKLMALALPGAEKKHRTEVVRLFLRRWIVVLPDEGDITTFTAASANAQLAKELVALTTRCAPDFPHEVLSSAPVVALLSGMVEEVRAQMTSARRRTKHTVSEEQFSLVMRGTVRTLWGRYQAAANAEEAVSSLATLHVLAQAGPEWLESLLDVLVQALQYPPAKTTAAASHAMPSSTSSSPTTTSSSQSEQSGGALLQICLIWRTVLSSSRVPSISLDRLARAMTVLLSKYVGPYQQRIILAACGALTVMITCGATNTLTTQHVQRPYLTLCYMLMNTYYVRVRALLPSLPREPQNVAYIQRFLFLLSEFVRLYPGWRDATPAMLTDEAVAASASGTAAASAVPNQLVKGQGICENVYQLAQDVLGACREPTTRGRVAVIVLRVLASVCMLDPSEYLYKCEPQLREALLLDADPALQTQGLTFIRDFLGEEDARVEQAARLTANAFKARPRGRRGVLANDDATTAAIAAALDAEAEDEEEAVLSDEEDNPNRGHGGRLRDQNSGMATWLLQRFHESVLALCGSPHAQIRALCLDVLQWTAQGGLLPPVKYLDVLVALSADSVPSLAQRARACLQAHADRHSETIASHATHGVLRAYQLHHACQLHLIRSAIAKNEAGVAPMDVSVHGPLFGLLRKRHRDVFLVSLLRYFYQDSKAAAWCREYGAAELPRAREGRRVDEDDTAFYTNSFVSLLGHLAVAITLLPFNNEGDLVRVLQQCRIGIDLVGQSALDTVNAALTADPTAGDEKNDKERDDSKCVTTSSVVLGLWQAVGVVGLYEMRRALIGEYRLTAQKLQRYMNGSHGSAGHHTPGLPTRRPGSPAMASFLEAIAKLVREATPCAIWVASKPRRDVLPPEAVLGGLQFLQQALETALLEDSAEPLVVGARASANLRSRAQGGGKATQTRGRAKKGSAKPASRGGGRARHHRRGRDSDSDESDDPDDDDESDLDALLPEAEDDDEAELATEEDDDEDAPIPSSASDED